MHFIIAITIVILIITIPILLIWKRTLELGEVKHFIQGHLASNAARFHVRILDSKLNDLFTMLCCEFAQRQILWKNGMILVCRRNEKGA